MTVSPHLLVLVALTGAVFTLSGCNLEDEVAGWRDKDVVDRPQKLSRDDYRNMNRKEKLLSEDGESAAALGVPPIPDVAQVIAAPRPPKVGNTKLVSIAVTDDVPLRDVLFELGRLADVDIEIGPGLSNRGINLRAKDKPFNQVIERISDLAGLRYSVKNGALRVERDTPYFKNYTLDFLNIVRSSTSNVNVTSNVLSSSVGGGSSGGGSTGNSSTSGGGGGGGGSSSGVSTGTTSSITAGSESDIWSSLEASITEILNTSASAADLAGAATAGIGSAGTEGAAGAAGTTAGGGGAGASGGASVNFVVNRQAGVLSANATERQHDKLAMYLKLLERNSSAQVLIEAKIVEVTLNDQFQSGINWSNLVGSIDSSNISLGSFQPNGGINDFSLGSNGAITFTLENGNLDAVLQMTQRFGTTRTLSSPRLHAINNQQAVLTFAQNRVIQTCSITEGDSATATDTGTVTQGPSYECEVSTIPIGIILNIMPSINLDSQEVTLNVRPTLSRQIDQVENASTRLAARALQDDELQSFIPIIEVREIDSVMKIKSGAVMIIGGLMEDGASNEERGVPGVSEIPWLGNAFKSRSELSQKRELIIFIKATVVNSSGSADPIDRSIMKKYTTDARPI